MAVTPAPRVPSPQRRTAITKLVDAACDRRYRSPAADSASQAGGAEDSKLLAEDSRPVFRLPLIWPACVGTNLPCSPQASTGSSGASPGVPSACDRTFRCGGSVGERPAPSPGRSAPIRRVGRPRRRAAWRRTPDRMSRDSASDYFRGLWRSGGRTAGLLGLTVLGGRSSSEELSEVL